MSTAPVSSVSPGAAAPDHAQPSRLQVFIKIALVLAAITFVELACIFLPLGKSVLLPTLVVLSAAKFIFVIFYFMHLRWDKLFCTVLFCIGLILAGFTMWALLRVFSAPDSKPLTAAAVFSVPEGTHWV
ncbi:MAG: cytochrome C oxidase subunit IV family protein [Opitutae bacterium]|nr:cytochrome C oxidase subunit IV family protein [Opitutae bacterium]